MPTISFDVPAIKTSPFETIDGGEKWGTLTGGVLATAGGLVFTGEGKEYVAVAAGGNSLWGFRQGGAVVVFGLAD